MLPLCLVRQVSDWYSSLPPSIKLRKSWDHLESSRCTHPPSGPCTIVSIGRYSAYTRDENGGSRHIAYAQILPRSSALLDLVLPRDIRRRSRTPCGTTCHRYRRYN